MIRVEFTENKNCIQYGYYILDRNVFVVHREDGPAVEYFNGTKIWFIENNIHREDGPAIEFENGDKEWRIKNLRHRDGGPAVELTNGNNWWYMHGELHREDGPAIEFANGCKEWWIDGDRVDGRKFKSLIKQYKINLTCK